MMDFLQVFVSGIATGCIYGLVALSFVLVYKATGIVSFMQGELLMAGAFIAVALTVAMGWPWWLGAPAAIALMAIGGGALERCVLRRAIGHPHLTAILLTFGLGMMLHGIVASVPAASQNTYRLAWPFAGEIWRFGPVAIAAGQVQIMIATASLLALLSGFFRRTRVGLALRACAQDTAMMALLGVPVERLHRLAWMIAAGIAAFAGLLLAPATFVQVNMGVVALKAFPAAVLGGMANLAGALLAGLFLGVVEALAGLMLPDGGGDFIAYALLLVALLLFPQGFGARLGALRR